MSEHEPTVDDATETSAEASTEEPTEHEPSERIVVKVFTRDEVRALLRTGAIVDAFSSLSLYRYFDVLDRT